MKSQRSHEFAHRYHDASELRSQRSHEAFELAKDRVATERLLILNRSQCIPSFHIAARPQMDEHIDIGDCMKEIRKLRADLSEMSKE